MKNTVTIHKDFNRSAIPFYKEIALNFFSEIMKKWNNEKEYKELIFTKQEIKEVLKLQNFKYLDDFLLQFTRETVAKFEIEGEKIFGTAFYFVVNDKKEIVEVHLQPKLVPYLFTKKDIEYMKKNKNKARMSPQELEEYKSNEMKYKKLMIFSQTDLLKFKSKYTKRLYMLLIQYKKTGFFIMNNNKFRKVLEIPKSYQQSKIDKRILESAIEELKKANIFIKEIIKNKQGGRDIKTIEIHFTYKEERKPKKLNIKTISPVTKSLADEYGMSVDERNQTGLEEIQKLKEKLKNLK